jgi:hypothetical protein
MFRTLAFYAVNFGITHFYVLSTVRQILAS